MTTYLDSARSAASKALNGLASFIEPQSPSSAPRTTHCSTCFCVDMPSDVLEEDWHLLRNGQPLSHVALQDRARQAADEFVEDLDSDGSIVDSRYLRVFSLYASQLGKLGTNYGYGVSYLTEAASRHEHRVARAAAEHVSRQGLWTDRARAIGQLRVKDPYLWKHLKDIEAAYKQESIQWAERVEASRKAESVTGTNEEGTIMRTDSSGV
jgi:hypothetical protein